VLVRIPDTYRAGVRRLLQVGRSAQSAWALYDFAYSLFAFLLAVRFFPTWIINDRGRPDWYVTVTQVVVALIVVGVLPIAGAVADQFGRRKPFLAVFTVASAAACAALSIVPSEGAIWPVLVVAGLAVGFSLLAFAQYDPLLADVAEPEEQGRVSGLAVALGFLGMIFGLVVVAEIIVGEGDKQRAFAPAGLLYLLFALPALVLVKERPRTAPRPSLRSAVRSAGAEVRRTVREASRYPQITRFLAGRFLYSDAIVTLSAFLAVYMTRLGGFSERDKNVAFGIAVVAAGAGAIVAGRIVERIGPKRPLVAVLPAFSAGILLSAAVGQPWTVWVVAPIVGVALGVVWTADRVFMLRLTPPELRGQLFGFFNLANRLASAIGPLIFWSGTIWVLHDRTGWLNALDASRVALGSLAAATLIGWAVIRPLAETPAAKPDTVAAVAA
jgi:MFS transporter, UMF1 family